MGGDNREMSLSPRGTRNRKKLTTAAQLDEAFDNYKKQQGGNETEQTSKQKMKGLMKEVSTYAPMVLLCLFAAAVLLLTVSQSLNMYDDSPEDENYYNLLGIKRMAKQNEIQVAHDKLMLSESNADKRMDIEEA